MAGDAHEAIQCTVQGAESAEVPTNKRLAALSPEGWDAPLRVEDRTLFTRSG